MLSPATTAWCLGFAHVALRVGVLSRQRAGSELVRGRASVPAGESDGYAFFVSISVSDGALPACRWFARLPSLRGGGCGVWSLRVRGVVVVRGGPQSYRARIWLCSDFGKDQRVEGASAACGCLLGARRVGCALLSGHPTRGLRWMLVQCYEFGMDEWLRDCVRPPAQPRRFVSLGSLWGRCVSAVALRLALVPIGAGPGRLVLGSLLSAPSVFSLCARSSLVWGRVGYRANSAASCSLRRCFGGGVAFRLVSRCCFGGLSGDAEYFLV
ncbi:hypothetical protein HNY73_022901 [Argiope bruennichi]|uniref:Uncharacterized protein n=1 Tax=Argiope bruennichi TaxID=94029 RepID=A0A8T0E4R2_ARGBR|nr:hypothetical protein HNY73_022901 [Argiope bruennichi]